MRKNKQDILLLCIPQPPPQAPDIALWPCGCHPGWSGGSLMGSPGACRTESLVGRLSSYSILLVDRRRSLLLAN